MNHQQWKEWVNLLAYEELDAEKKRLTEDHLSDCEACRSELNQIKRLHRVMDNHAVQIPTDALLQDARQELRAAIRLERNKPAASPGIRKWFSGFIPNFQIAAGLAAMLIMGFVGGYLIQNMRTPETQPASATNRVKDPLTNATLAELIQQPEVAISNIRFMDADASDGEVEFAFDAVRPMKVKGNINDAPVQKMLTYALVSEQNDGVRLRAVNTIGAHKSVSADPLVKDALITALKTDSNDAVRKEAMIVLKTYDFDAEIQEAFLYVLQRDANAALRIEAIKSLEGKKIQNQEILDVLKEKSESDDNSYIRRRAKDYLKEVSQQ